MKVGIGMKSDVLEIDILRENGLIVHSLQRAGNCLPISSGQSSRASILRMVGTVTPLNLCAARPGGWYQSGSRVSLRSGEIPHLPRVLAPVDVWPPFPPALAPGLGSPERARMRPASGRRVWLEETGRQLMLESPSSKHDLRTMSSQ